MIPNGEKRVWSNTLAMRAKSKGCETKSKAWRLWHYRTVKKLSALLRGITSKQEPSLYHIKNM